MLLADSVTIAVSQIVSHPSLDEVYVGIRQGLADEGYVDEQNCEILYENAQGRMPIAVQIAQKFASEDPGVVVGISTPSTQTLMNAFKGKETPIVFASISDPLGARFVESFERPGGNVTGTRNPFLAHRYALKITQLFPKARKVGVLLNLSEANSVAMFAQLKEALAQHDILAVEAPVASPVDVKAAAESLVGKIDLLFLIQDNTVASALSSFLPVMNRNQIPTMACFGEAVDQGALMAMYVSEFKIGYETGKIIARILKGEKPQDIAVMTVQDMAIKMNHDVADLLQLSDAFVQQVQMIKVK
jgi:putative ABC transport system substrate-binding protein